MMPKNKRNARIARKPRCGEGWLTIVKDTGHCHYCEKFKGHLNRHICFCGASKLRAVASQNKKLA
jgi:hypothetical protein